MYGKKEVHASVVVSGSSSRALRSFRIMRTRVQWQVEYWRHGEPHWWDYPAYVNDDLELIKGGWSVGAGGSDYIEFTYQYPQYPEKHDVDDKGCMDSDPEDVAPRPGGTYHLYPKAKQQLNSKPDSVPRPMRRIFIDR